MALFNWYFEVTSVIGSDEAEGKRTRRNEGGERERRIYSPSLPTPNLLDVFFYSLFALPPPGMGYPGARGLTEEITTPKLCLSYAREQSWYHRSVCYILSSTDQIISSRHTINVKSISTKSCALFWHPVETVDLAGSSVRSSVDHDYLTVSIK